MKSISILFSVLIMSLNIAGCSIIGHVDEIKTIAAYSREKDNQHRLVHSINAQYDALLKVIANGSIRAYKDKRSCQQAFGEPILKKSMGDGAERWLYRYAIFKFAKSKVYLYFDHENRLIKWEQLSCSLP